MSEKKSDENRISAVPPFGLRMLPELRDRIREEAERNGRSMNAEIIARLEASIHPDSTVSGDTFILKMPKGMRKQISEASKENGWSMNEEIIDLLEERFPTPWDPENTKQDLLRIAAPIIQSKNPDELEINLRNANLYAETMDCEFIIEKNENDDRFPLQLSVRDFRLDYVWFTVFFKLSHDTELKLPIGIIQSSSTR